MRRCITLISSLAALASFHVTSSAAILSAAAITPNSLVITEYMADPIGVSDSEGEYFEIYNTTSFDIDLNDLIVKDDGSNSFTITGLTIGAGAFAIFSNFDGVALGFTPDYIYSGSMTLTNTDDEIGLFRPDEMLVNKVAYSDGDFFGDGIAHELTALDLTTPTLLFGPQLGSNFAAATSSLALGNFGSPGFAGGTSINLTAVPVPAAVWMFGSALSILGWMRRKLAPPAIDGDEVDNNDRRTWQAGSNWRDIRPAPGRFHAKLGRL